MSCRCTCARDVRRAEAWRLQDKHLRSLPVQYRTVRRFAWWTKTVGGERVWLRRYDVKQRTHVTFFPMSWGLGMMGLEWRDEK